MNINLRGPMSTFLGYGHCCFNIAKALDKLGHNIAYFPIGTPQLTSGLQTDYDLVSKWLRAAETFDYLAPCLNVWHENQTATHIGYGPHNYLAFFESDTLDHVRKHQMGFPDRIIAPSKWAKEVLEKNGITKQIVVVPMGVDPDVYNTNPIPKSADEPTKFLCIGKKEVRKGHDILIEAFNAAFEPEDDVQLIMLWANPFLSEPEGLQWDSLYKQSKLGPVVRLHNSTKSDAEYLKILKDADCCVFPSRSEGFGMPILQSICLGKPVITTNYSAMTEFCTNSNSMLIEVDELEAAYDGKWFHGTGSWAKYGKSQMDQLVAYLRLVHKANMEGRLNSVVGKNFLGECDKTRQAFSWEQTALKLQENLL